MEMSKEVIEDKKDVVREYERGEVGWERRGMEKRVSRKERGKGTTRGGR